jgi:hypothetical protein
MNTTAARARDLALKKHRREVMFWKGILLPVLAVGLSVGVAVGMLIQEAIEGEPQVWRTGKGPALHPLYVVTQGYVDSEGEWRCYENGMPLTITHWTPVQP